MMAKIVLPICHHLRIEIANCVLDHVFPNMFDDLVWLVKVNLVTESPPVTTHT